MARDKRLLFLDEDLDVALARELRVRGRLALSIYKTMLVGGDDAVVVDALNKRYGTRAVFVTANYWMPVENGEDFGLGEIALAVVDSQHPDGYHLKEWRSEVVHRWAHSMQEQAPGSIVRYGLRRGPWTMQKRLWPPASATTSLAERYGRRETEFDWISFPGDAGHPTDAA